MLCFADDITVIRESEEDITMLWHARKMNDTLKEHYMKKINGKPISLYVVNSRLMQI